MGQMTWRMSDDLLLRVRAAAEREGRSMNDYVTAVLDAATNPELATDEGARVRERLAAAGLLVPPGPPHKRPDPKEFEAARKAAGKGKSLVDFVVEGRE
jgi:plasmid stability protein